MNSLSCSCALLALVIAFAACDGKKDGEHKGSASATSTAPDDKAKASALPMSEHTWDMSHFSIVGLKPEWDENKMGDDSYFYQGKGFSGPQLWLSSTCEGYCGSEHIPANLQGAAAEQRRMHDTYYQDVEIVLDEALEDGHHFRLKMRNDQGELGQYVRFYFREGWPETVAEV